MRATRITTNLRVDGVEAAKGFYTDYLGLSTEEFNLGWVLATRLQATRNTFNL